MDLERAIETQRFRLLRIIAGLLVAVGFMSAGPVSRGFSDWVCEYVDSILSRAELAARYLVIAQARLIAARSKLDVDRRRFSEGLTSDACETELSLGNCRARLMALQAVLLDLPREARRLLRWIEKPRRREPCAAQTLLRPDRHLSAPLRGWQLAANRIERPPDNRAGVFASPLLSPPPGIRAGGADGSASF